MDEKQRKLLEELLINEDEQPSFVKRAFFGEYTPCKYSKTIPIGSLNELKLFLKDELDPDFIDRNCDIPRNTSSRLSEIGMLGYTVPKEYGGRELSQSHYCQAMELVAARCSSTALFLNAHHSIGLRALLLFGTKDQKDTWLKPLALGEKIAAFALTEPNAGSDAGGVETTATYNSASKTYILNGRKQWITNGSIADVLTVMAKTEDGKITAFLVSPEMKGFEVHTAALEKVGMRGTKTAILDFNNVEVPETNILGPKGKGLRVCLTVLDFGRVTFGATCTGMAKECLKRAIEHSQTRVQFGKPLVHFELVKKMLSSMAALTYAMDATTYLTAGLLDGGKSDIMVEAAILKVFNSESSWKVLYDAMQIFGGRSFFTDEPFERMMRDSRLNMIGEGSNEVLKAFIAAVGLREVGLSLKESFSHLGKLIIKPSVPTQFKAHGKALAKDIRRFGYIVVKLLVSHREGIVEKQYELERITTCITSIYTRTAVLKRMDAEGLSKEGLLYLELSKEEFREAYSKIGKSKIDQMYTNLADALTGVK